MWLVWERIDREMSGFSRIVSKRIFSVFAVVLVLVSVLASCAKFKGNVIGMWQCELYGSVQIIEFTDDGRFIDHTGGVENKYRIDGSDIVVFVEDVPESEVRLEYEVTGDTLKLGGAEYTKYNNNTGKDADVPDSEEQE